MACGEEMRLVQVVPDDAMPVPGYEHHTLECPGCHEVERRLVFTRESEPVPFEPRPLPPAPHRVELAAASAEPSADIVPNAVTAAPSATAPSSSWARAVDRLRQHQSSLQARQADTKASATASQTCPDWQEVVRSRRLTQATAAAQAPSQPLIGKDLPEQPDKPASAPVAADRSRPSPAPSSAMARVIARLRLRDAWPPTAGGTADERRHFDQMWDSFAPQAQSPAPTSLPQPVADGSAGG